MIQLLILILLSALFATSAFVQQWYVFGDFNDLQCLQKWKRVNISGDSGTWSNPESCNRNQSGDNAQMPADFTNGKIVNINDPAVMSEYWLDQVQPFADSELRESLKKKAQNL